MVKITAIPGHFTIDDLAQGIKVSIEYSPEPYSGKNYRVNIWGRYTAFPNLNTPCGTQKFVFAHNRTQKHINNVSKSTLRMCFYTMSSSRQIFNWI